MVAGSPERQMHAHHIPHLPHPSPPLLQSSTYNRTNAGLDRVHGTTHGQRSKRPFTIPGPTSGVANTRKILGFSPGCPPSRILAPIYLWAWSQRARAGTHADNFSSAGGADGATRATGA